MTAVSSCGGFIACGCRDGVVVVWDAVSRSTVLTEKHPKSLSICGLAWNPSGKKELAFVDVEGQFGTLENVIDQDYKPKSVSNSYCNCTLLHFYVIIRGNLDFLCLMTCQKRCLAFPQCYKEGEEIISKLYMSVGML